MKKKILFLSFGILLSLSAHAEIKCFLVTENNKVIQQIGECTLRHSPCSTFKIALSVMGYDGKILIDETHPKLPFKKGYVEDRMVWKQPHDPTLWIKNSCVWYSQWITQKLGMKKFKDYIKKFNYGNQDVSGDLGQHNGLTHSWLSSSLKISPWEQIQFLKKLIYKQLPVSLKSQEMTQNILFIEELPYG